VLVHSVQAFEYCSLICIKVGVQYIAYAALAARAVSHDARAFTSRIACMSAAHERARSACCVCNLAAL
jgi:hypothetical protein